MMREIAMKDARVKQDGPCKLGVPALPKERGVEHQLNSLHKQISELESALESLTAQLAPVRNALPEVPSNSAGRTDAPRSYIADSIANAEHRVGVCVSRIAVLAEEIDL